MWTGTQVEIDVICRLDDAAAQPIVVDEVTRGIRRGDWVFLSAHCAPTGPADQPGVAAQTEKIIADLARFAAAAGSSLQRAVKAEVFLRNAHDLPSFDRVWSAAFAEGQRPARVVATSVSPRHPLAVVEIALTLLTDDSTIGIETVQTPDAPTPLGAEPQAVLAGDLLFLSTQLAFDDSGALAAGTGRSTAFPWYGTPGRAQMRVMLDNVAAICTAGGTSIENIVRRVCYHNDLQWFGESISEWAAEFPGVKPASTTFGVAGPLAVPGANTMLDLIAYVPEQPATEGAPQ